MAEIKLQTMQQYVFFYRYMFDGLQFDPTARFEYQFNPQREEAIKSQIIKNYISIQADEIILPGVLDNDELVTFLYKGVDRKNVLLIN
jgi:hypothetical protein